MNRFSQTPNFPAALLGCLLSLAAVASGEDLTLADFENGYGPGWEFSGDAFQNGPASGHLLGKLEIENSSGNGVASSGIKGDGPRGKLVSPEFAIERKYLTFLIAGGDYEHSTCVNLRIGGKTVRSATGWNSDRMVPITWDLGSYTGKTARLEIVDAASGNWGHINVDAIVQTDHPAFMPAPAAPLYQEHHRPGFHFTARQWTTDRLNPGMRQEGWLNDLNGLIYYEGEYHLFAQRWNKCWIHAVSRDLVHWTELEPAFWEEELDSGVQSGTCVIDYRNSSGLSPDKATPPMIAFWSRNDNRSQCLSYSLDKGRTWKHYDKNPILTLPERDPKVFWHEASSRWVMLLYGDDAYHVLTSTNLLDWKKEEEPIRKSFECPDLFRLPVDGQAEESKWVLIRGDGKYSIGEFDGTRYLEETEPVPCDVGPHFYATQTWENTSTGDGRRIQTAWMRGGLYPDMPFNQQISFPCELTLRSTPDGVRLFREPARELSLLHDGEQSWRDITLRGGATLNLASSGDLFRIKAEVTIPEGGQLIFNLRGASVVLTSNMLECGGTRAPVRGTTENIEILLDRTSVEVFVNRGELSLSRCMLPETSGLWIRAEGNEASIRSMVVHRLRSAWKTP